MVRELLRGFSPGYRGWTDPVNDKELLKIFKYQVLGWVFQRNVGPTLYSSNQVKLNERKFWKQTLKNG